METKDFKNKDTASKYKNSNKIKITLESGLCDFQLSGRTIGDITEQLNTSQFIYIGNTCYSTCTITKVERLEGDE